MKVLRKVNEPTYYHHTLVHYNHIYIVDKIPKKGEYIETEDKKGYVVSSDYDEETNSINVYLEKKLGDWDNQLIETCDVVLLREGL